MPVKSLLCLGALALLSPIAKAQVSFQFDYSDASAALWSLESRNALTTAANHVSAYLPGYTTIITMKVTGSNANSGSLASAGSSYAISPGFNNKGIIGTKILGGGDANGSGFDGSLDANFFYNWSFTDTASVSQYDFVSVMMHEIAHAIGFTSLIAENGGSVFGDNLSSAEGFYGPFDSFLVNGDGEYLVGHTPGNYVTGDDWLAARTNGIFFNGPNAVAVYGDNVPIYSPNPWAEGSSGSHLDTTVFTDEDRKLMNHSVTQGLGERAFSELEVAMFRDLGFTNFSIPVPEPGTGLLLTVTAGFFLRRKRSA